MERLRSFPSPLMITSPLPNIRFLWYADDIVIVNLIEQDYIIVPRSFFEI
jgi:hypothetical protein